MVARLIIAGSLFVLYNCKKIRSYNLGIFFSAVINPPSYCFHNGGYNIILPKLFGKIFGNTAQLSKGKKCDIIEI